MTDDAKTAPLKSRVASGKAESDSEAGKNALALSEEAEAAESERKLGRTLSFAVPAAAVVGALAVGSVTSAGPAILVLVGGALLGAIALFWASLRTLGGDAPLSHDMEFLMARGERTDLNARKQVVLRALKDLKHEHSIGKIDDADYQALEAKYRSDAKEIFRELDVEVEPYRARAEALAKKHLSKVGLADETSGRGGKSEVTNEAPADDVGGESDELAAKNVCKKCSTPNDLDAAFCKKCGTSLAKTAEDESNA